MIGWARLWMGTAEGGGLNQVVTQLTSELVRRGHRVIYLRSGLDYSLRRGVRIERERAWEGVECFDVVNSPNLSIGSANFENVREQIESPEHSRLLARFLKDERVGVLHIHAFEGVAFDLVRAVQNEAGIPVVVTPHNYVALCPQIDLLHQERRVCDDYQGGTRCVDCLKVPDFAWERERRAKVHTIRRVMGARLYEALKPSSARIVRGVVGLLPKGTKRHTFEPPSAPSVGFAEDIPAGAPLGHERLLKNSDRHLVVLNEYGTRRQAGVRAMNEAAMVLAPGRFLASVHRAMGVANPNLRHEPLGLRHLDELRDRTRQSATYESTAWRTNDARPLRLVYFGNCWVNKGLGILVDAILRLDPATLARLELDIYASGDDRPHRERLASFRNIRFHGAFTSDDQARALEDADVGVFPGIALENSPLVIMEMLAAGRFVIASRRGAMEEFVKPGIGGLLFEPGGSDALASEIRRVVTGETLLPTRREVQQSSIQRTFAEFVDAMQRAYREVIH